MIKPLHDRVLVRRLSVEQVSRGGIILSEAAPTDNQREGIVEAIGPDVQEVAVGDRVVMGKWSGEDTKIEGENLVMIRESDIFGVLENG